MCKCRIRELRCHKSPTKDTKSWVGCNQVTSQDTFIGYPGSYDIIKKAMSVVGLYPIKTYRHAFSYHYSFRYHSFF